MGHEQRHAPHTPSHSSPVVQQALRTPSEPLAPSTRASMESSFGSDFSGVRVHADRAAADSARALDASAYAVGSHIVFGAGAYAPQTTRGRTLLAHELAHVMQQQQPGSARQPATAGEPEARAAGYQVAGGRVSPARTSVPALTVQRQQRSRGDLERRLAEVRSELGVGAGVRSPEATERLRAEERELMAALKQLSADDLRRQLDENRRQQSVGTGVRSPEATEKLKEQERELQARLAVATSVGMAAPSAVRAGPGQPLVDWGAGNSRGIPAEGQVLAGSYPNATRLPAGYPGVDFIEGGTRTPLTGFGRGAGGKLPLTSDSFYADGGTLIQLKTLKNSSPSYQEPGRLFAELSKGLEKLASIKPGAGKSERAGAQYRRVEHSGTADRKILHVELETPPTPQQAADIERLREAGKSFKDFGPGEEIEVVVRWPGTPAKSLFKITPEGFVGGVSLGVAVAGMYGREKLRERQQETEGYAPVGLAAHGSDGLAVRAGAFFRGDQMEMFGQPSLPNMPVWRNNIRQKAAGKKPGATIVFTWQYQHHGPIAHVEDVDVTYEKRPDGSWSNRPVSDPPAGFSVPDLNRLIDPGVSDSQAADMLTGPHA